MMAGVAKMKALSRDKFQIWISMICTRVEAMDTGIIIKEVTAYSGYKANERPLDFTIDNQRLKVRDIISRWVEPEKDFFKVIADDDKIYTLSWDPESELWRIEKK
jgi:hypothetical protein